MTRPRPGTRRRICAGCEREFEQSTSRTKRPKAYCSTTCYHAATTLDFTSLVQRFWARVDKSGGPDACWPWKGHTNPKGYGAVRWAGGSQEFAHRMAFFVSTGELPEAVRHIVCDNPPCCNPRHLAAGTVLDNNADMIAKGRQARGEGNGAAKLTAAQVLAIRGDTRNGVEIAAAYAISTALVSLIRAKKVWAHV